MINYGYFRHRFDAHENPKLNSLVDLIGIEAYGYYYTLLEIYGQHYSKNKDSLEVKIHLRVIANVWRKRIDSVRKILELLEKSGLIVTTKLELSSDLVGTKLELSSNLVGTKSNSTLLLSIPNFLKYYGSYKKTKGDNASNKRKEKKIKEKKSNNTPRKQVANAAVVNVTQEAIEHLNKMTGSKFRIGKTSVDLVNNLIKNKYTVDDVKQVINTKCQEWYTDPKMKKFLRPSTLFRLSNFENYIGQTTNTEEKETIEQDLIESLGG